MWGCFTVYPSYRTFYTNLFVNERITMAQLPETGFRASTHALVPMTRRGLPTSRRWEFKWDGAVSLAALLGCSGILLHSFVDFNLQIPANAALFYVLCALATSELSSQSSRSSRTRRSEAEKIREISRGVD